RVAAHTLIGLACMLPAVPRTPMMLYPPSVTEQGFRAWFLDDDQLGAAIKTYNPSIAEVDGRYWLVYRQEIENGAAYSARIQLAVLDHGWKCLRRLTLMET